MNMLLWISGLWLGYVIYGRIIQEVLAATYT